MIFSSLICEFKEDKDQEGNLVVQKHISLGRFSFWLTFICMAYFWFTGGTVPASLYDVFFMMVLYNFFKKTLSTIETADLKAMFEK